MRESRLDVDDAVCVIGSDRKMIFVRDLFNNRSLTDKRIVKQRAVEDAKRTPSERELSFEIGFRDGWCVTWLFFGRLFG